MALVTCDRCGADSEPVDPTTPTSGTGDIGYGTLTYQAPNQDGNMSADVCASCSAEFEAWLLNPNG